MINWPKYLTPVKKHIKDFKVPYVTRLSRDYQGKKELPFVILISTLISLRTKDITTEKASEALFEYGTTPKALLELSESKMAKLIYPCAFYKTRAKQILKVCEILVSGFKGNVPNDLETLITLPGVGRKTANLVLTEGFDTHGICVDTHVHRILNRWGILKTKSPDETELFLRKHLPKRYWKQINYWLVMFGQYHCKPVRPKCSECLLSDLCVSSPE